MFTGLIEQTGIIKHKKSSATTAELGISVDKLWLDIEKGESIAINGVCLTVTHWQRNEFFVDVSQPTLASTNLGALKNGARVNLERALRVGDRMGGHMVQGHVDGTGTVKKITQKKENWFLSVSAAPELLRDMVDKGSIAVDGVSLTIQELHKDSFTVVIIPHTWTHTTFSHLKVKDKVNIECDILSKYVKQHITTQKKPLTVNDFKKHGF